VNDVTAMKSADVAVALLNGFGDEKDLIDGKDFDDERRRKKVEAKLLGSQRLTHGQVTKVKRKEARDSFNMKLQKAQAKIRERAAARSGTDSDDSNNVAFDLQDAKEMVSATLAVVREERTREKSLKCGGGDAARLLAEERRKSSAGDDDDGGDETETVPAIKPGEASLVAPFSCLHPSIEGVDSVLRAGVATAACALATQELIALNSLMSCFGLATLYRDGFRYGKHMSMVEMMLYVLVDQQRYAASCTPRPRLPKAQYLRPPRSMFQPSAILRTLGQAGVNLVTMSIGVRYARRLEGASSIGGASKYHLQIEGSNPPKISKMLSALVASSSTGEASKKEKDEDDDDDDDDAAGTASLFRRPPFCPNYETNMVFILSILQNMLVSLASHKGKPFYRAILEDRPLTTLSVATLGLCVALIAETAPKLNTLLQLKAMPTKKSQAVFFGIVLLNIVASNLVNRIFSKTDSTIITTEEEKAKTSNVEDCNDLLAADLEERLLEEESSQNLRSAVIALALLTYLAIEALVKS
jgi:cation-transporting ATPase 13A1